MKVRTEPKRVYKGKIFDVYQWQQKMFDGSYQTFERVRLKSSAIVIATVKDKMVVLKQKQPTTDWLYTTPSGRLDVEGETPKEAAKRELLEETGMVAKEIVFWKVVKQKGKVLYDSYIFIARDCKKIAPQNLDGGEKIKVKLVSFEEYLKLALDPKCDMYSTRLDMFKALLDPKYKKYLRKIIFG